MNTRSCVTTDNNTATASCGGHVADGTGFKGHYAPYKMPVCSEIIPTDRGLSCSLPFTENIFYDTPNKNAMRLIFAKSVQKKR